MAGREVSGAGAELGRRIAPLGKVACGSAERCVTIETVVPKQRMADHTQEILYAKVEDP